MTIHELLDDYKVGDITWEYHGEYGTAPKTVQYDMDGDASYHITINHDHKGVITGMHFTISEPGKSLHLYYYADKNQFHLDPNGFRGVDGGDVEDAKAWMSGFCRASQYKMDAFNGKFTYKTRDYLGWL